MKIASTTFNLLALFAASSQAFAPSGLLKRAYSSSTLCNVTPAPKEEEKMLKQEIAEKNSIVENEEQYSLRDGAGMEAIFVTDDQQQAPDQEPVLATTSESFQLQMDRMTKPRAYPLFLAEKAAEIVEHALDDLFKSSIVDMSPDGVKEKIVVLGTGWGAAAFLKDIDTSKYDVTVISPRNYFLFTPMLAGASVGTVEYRSITEPVREVR
jgi:hypothetical protein